jgi:antitoxin component YwqK of YwqJK toxin-antitoxin module
MERLKVYFILGALLVRICTAQDLSTGAKAFKLYQDGEYEASIACFDSALAYDPENTNFMMIKHNALFKTEHYEEAIHVLERMYVVEPLDEKYFFNMSQCYDKMKKYPLALFYINIAIFYNPLKSHYRHYRAGLLLEMEQYQKAERDIEYVLHENPDNYQMLFFRGIAKFNQKRVNEACMDWLQARDFDSNSKNYHFLYCTKKDLSENRFQPVKIDQITEPQFTIHLDSIHTYLGERLCYPTQALFGEKEGLVVAKMIIGPDSKLDTVIVFNPLSKEIEGEVRGCLSGLASMILKPAYLNGKPVEFVYYIPFRFRLQKPEGVDLGLWEQRFKTTNNADDDVWMLSQNPFQYELYTEIKKKGFPHEKSWEYELYNDNQLTTKFITEVRPAKKYVKIYYDSLWLLCNVNAASFYRICEWTDNHRPNGRFVDYTMDGEIFSEGNYNAYDKHGVFRSFFPNGQLKSEVHFHHDNPIGTWKYYFNNGNLQHMFDVNGELFNILEYYDSLGNPILDNGIGEWEYVSPDYTGQNLLKLKGQLVKGIRDGYWEFSRNNEKLLEEYYNMGKFKKGLYYQNGRILKTQQPSSGSWVITPLYIARSEMFELDKGLPDSYYLYLGLTNSIFIEPPVFKE